MPTPNISIPQTLLGQYPPTGGAFGAIPGLPNPISTSTTAIGGNIGNLGSLYGLGTGITNLTNQEAASGLIANLPNYQTMTQQASADITSNLQGQVPADVWKNIQQAGAERGVATGSPGSPNANAAMLRALGLTTLDLQTLGQTQFNAAVARTPVGRPFDPNTMLVTPEQQQAAETGQAFASAAPNPAAAAAANQAALRAGLAAGMGAGGGPGGGGPPPYVAPAAGPQTIGPVGGTGPFTPTEDPNTAYTNWSNWIASLPANKAATALSEAPSEPGYASPAQQTEVEQMRNAGYSEQEIADELGLTANELGGYSQDENQFADVGPADTGE